MITWEKILKRATIHFCCHQKARIAAPSISRQRVWRSRSNRVSSSSRRSFLRRQRSWSVNPRCWSINCARRLNWRGRRAHPEYILGRGFLSLLALLTLTYCQVVFRSVQVTWWPEDFSSVLTILFQFRRIWIKHAVTQVNIPTQTKAFAQGKGEKFEMCWIGTQCS